MSGSVVVVGLGPGDAALMAPQARAALESADVILGYTTYLKFIQEIAPDTPRHRSGMRQEVPRALEALGMAAEGKRVAVVSSGDAGVYGMAGLLFEVRDENGFEVEIEVIPGISALNAAASLLGAPLMTDFAVISLSDQLTPLPVILKRVEHAAQADFVLCLYNPKGRKRVIPFEETCRILAAYRGVETPVGIVRAAYRAAQQITVIPLADLPHAEIDMVTILIVGNSSTTVQNGKMITPRGYENKYDLKGE